MFFKSNKKKSIAHLIKQYKDQLEQLTIENLKVNYYSVDLKDRQQQEPYYYCSKYYLNQIIKDLENLDQ